MISNIVISCLNPDIKTKTALLLSDKLDMLHADIDELIKYDVINPQDVIEKVGLDYFNKLVDKQVYNVSSYENTVITASDEIITNSRHISTLKTSALFIYLRISYKAYKKYISKKKKGILEPKDIIDLNMFFDKEKIITKSSNIIIDIKLKNIKHITKKIIKEIKKYYK